MSFAIVGAGVGGLATALRLAHRGHRVTVFEKNDQVGGRNRERQVGSVVFDAGPTLMMMLDPFRKLFADVGERLEDHLDLVRCDPNYRVFFADGIRLDCTSDVAKMTNRIEALCGAKDAARYPEMLKELGDLYHASIPQFVRRNYDSVLDLIRPKSLEIALRHRMLGNLAKGIGRYFDDPRLRMLFCLQTMYLGLSPHDAPFVYAVLVYMEYGEGIWYPMGGMVEIGRAIARLAEVRGVQIRLNEPVCRVDGKTVVLESGERFEADAVIINADLPYAEQALLGIGRTGARGYLGSQEPALSADLKTAEQTLLEERRTGARRYLGRHFSSPASAFRKERRYSCSAYMMYIDYAGEIPELLHHNILLGSDFDENLDQLFRRFEIPNDPAFYVAISSKTDPARAVTGHENLFILVPCPNLTHCFTPEDAQDLQEKVFARLEGESSFRRTEIARMETTDPHDWAEELNLDRGAAFGLSHDLLQSVCFRPSNKSREHEGVYFVGASTNPGNGLPMVLIGAELVERRLEADGLV
jgi:phytoene desaturase